MARGTLSVGILTVIVTICFVTSEHADLLHRNDVFTSKTTAAAYNQSMYWGTYRPNLYHGMRTRSADPVSTGLAWFGGSRIQKMRHACQQEDRLPRYGWLQHDGQGYGIHEIQDDDNGVSLNQTWVKSADGKQWSVRIEGSAFGQQDEEHFVNIFYYITTARGTLSIDSTSSQTTIHGHTSELGDYAVVIKEDSSNTHPSYSKAERKKFKVIGDISKPRIWAAEFEPGDQWTIKDVMGSHLGSHYAMMREEVGRVNEKNRDRPVDPPRLVPLLPDEIQENANVVTFQRVFKLPFQFDVAFLSQASNPDVKFTKGKKRSVPSSAVDDLIGDALTESIKFHRADFESRFSSTFHIDDPAKNFTQKEVSFAAAVLGNLMGGMGYFHGDYYIKAPASGSQSSPEQSQVMVMGPASLFTAVPSRSFFPRGFLWDEGFHQLLISQWDLRISIDILKHWFNMMFPDGWIPREQILGDEARSKVPREFQVQQPTHANPPTLFFVIEHLISLAEKGGENSEEVSQFLKSVFPRMEKNYEWLKETQKGHLPNTFRWRGRTENHTLSSGLDDYPRASPPSEKELHVDLQSWMINTARILSRIQKKITGNSDENSYDQDAKAFTSQLEALYWDANANSYADVLVGETDTQISHVTHKGYVTLFPLLLGIVPKDSPRLKATLDAIRSEDHLWTNYGLRSLSLSDPYFGTGENYWKGPIWININYLTLASLKNHYMSDGPHVDQATEIYTTLRRRLIKNLYRNYARTGYLWEQYSPVDGKGQRSHPFTGWSSLIVLIMSEK